MTTWLVTRHPGALAWLQAQGFEQVVHVPHLEPALVKRGDTVVGTLPVHLAAAVCGQGARYLHLSLDIPPEARGQELDLEQMRRYGARLEQYRVEAVRAAHSSRSVA